MSEIEEQKIAELERELRGVQEMLFLVLDEVVEPVQVPAAKVKAGIRGDKMIDITLDTDKEFWTFRVKDIVDEQ